MEIIIKKVILHFILKSAYKIMEKYNYNFKNPMKYNIQLYII